MTKKDDGATKSMSTGTDMRVGIALGVAFGAAFENVGLGLAIGVALGGELGGVLQQRSSDLPYNSSIVQEFGHPQSDSRVIILELTTDHPSVVPMIREKQGKAYCR